MTPAPSPNHPKASSAVSSPAEDLEHSEALPPVSQSFLRWSKTASTLFSEPSAFYFDGRRSTGQFSDLNLQPLPAVEATPHMPSQPAPSNAVTPISGSRAALSQPATDGVDIARPNMYRRESTNSAGTFGARHRSWSAVQSGLSASAGSEASPEIALDSRLPGINSIVPSDPQPGQTSATAPTSTSRHRRHLSMSSATDSTWSNAGPGQVLGGEPRVHIGRSSVPGATFPSPTLRRPAHNAPESEADITTHLLKASSKNDARIVPAPPRPPRDHRELMAGFFTPRAPPPTAGTPLDGGLSEESMMFDDRAHRTERRKTSKLDQILGEGAETARILMEFDRRAIVDSVQLPGTTRLPPPPRHGHKVSASVSSIPILPPSTPSNLSPSRTRFNRAEIYASPRRSNSMDSIPSSLNPSLTESTHTLARLLPPQLPAPTSALPLVPQVAEPKPEARNELSPEHRAVLLRRARKIERMLGETLGETQVDQHVVRPSTAAAITVVTSVDTEWPSSPILGGNKVPEYERQDCQPRIVRDAATGHALPGLPGLSRSNTTGKAGGSKMAAKAMAALGLKSDQGKVEADGMKVYVSREKTVTETLPSAIRGARPAAIDDQPRIGINRSSEESFDSPPLDSPRSPVEAEWVTEEDMARRTRRLQVAKLHRVLGEPIPSTAFKPLHSNCFDTITGMPIDRPDMPRRATSASDVSYLSFDERGLHTSSPPQSLQTWSKRVKAVVGGSRDKEREREKQREDKDRAKREAAESGGALSTGLTSGFSWTRAKSPSQDRFLGFRDGLEGSFVDMKDAKRVPSKGMGAGRGK